MYKIEYEEKKNGKVSYDKALGFTYNRKTMYTFSTDLERIESMIEWIFENTTGRFFALGTDTYYFEFEEDAMAFKLRWV